MLYYNKNDILVRNMEQDDIQMITDEEIAQEWPADVKKYEMRFQNQIEGKSIALAAEYLNIVYLGVGLHSGYGSAQRMYVKRGYAQNN